MGYFLTATSFPPYTHSSLQNVPLASLGLQYRQVTLPLSCLLVNQHRRMLIFFKKISGRTCTLVTVFHKSAHVSLAPFIQDA